MNRMKRKPVNRLPALLLVLIMAVGVLPALAKAGNDDLNASGNAENIYRTTGKYLAESVTNPGVAQIGGDWTVLGLARAGYPVPEDYYASYYQNVAAYVKANINDQERLHSNRSTDNSRVILGLTAAGYDVTNIGGHNLLQGLTDMKYLDRQGINGPIWALVAFDSGSYEIPAAPDGADPVTREKLIQAILDRRLANGGWNLRSAATTADPDMTAMALTALAPYGKTDSAVKAAIDKALQLLSAMQGADGGYTGSYSGTDGSTGSGSESCAQVIVALTALGIDPHTDTRFIKNGHSVVDALYDYYAAGGGFKHVADGGRDGMATEQGYYALAAYDRFLNGKTRLYDMTDVAKDPVGEETPKTGDDLPAALCVAGMVIGFTGMAAALQSKKRS